MFVFFSTVLAFSFLLISACVLRVYGEDSQEHSSSFTVWANSELLRNDAQQIQGKLCTEFTPTTHEDYERPDHPIVRVIYYTTTPGGKLFNVTSPVEAEKTNDGCTLVRQLNPTDEVGKYSVYAEISWYSNGISHNATSNTFTYEVRQGIFQNAKITKISNSTAFLRDWSSDGKFMIGDRLAMISPNGTALASPIVPEGLEDISIPSISPNNDQLLFLAKHGIGEDENHDIFRYQLRDDSVLQLTSNPKLSAGGFVDRVVGATWLPDGRILYVQSELDTDNTSKQKSSLWIANSDGKKVERVLILDGNIFSQVDVSAYNKVVFVKVQPHPQLSGLTQDLLLTFDMNSKKLFEVPYDFGTSCLSMAEWAANSNLIVYEVQTCHRVPGGSIEVISEDGQFHESIYGSINAPYTSVVAPDGSKLIFSTGSWDVASNGMYQMEFSHPMPEFSLLTATILLFSGLLAVIVLVNWKNKREPVPHLP